MASLDLTLPLHNHALSVLTTADAKGKASLTLAICAAWRAGLLALGSNFSSTAVPAEPVRPATVQHVHPTRVKNSTKKHMLHALCHAESYAIDLSWDIILRFGWSPDTWSPAPPSSCAGAHLPREFFDDWVRIAGEEATHFTRWSTRLEELGGVYGAFPAHGSLWESAAVTSSSLAARLAVVHCVHEGRGLDVASMLHSKLSAGGDEASAAILTMNLAEEVTHVAAGVKWFSQLCTWGGEASPIPLFHTLVRQNFHGDLKPPFAHEERKTAGMSEEWYLPLCKPKGEGEGGEPAAVELSAEDMG